MHMYRTCTARLGSLASRRLIGLWFVQLMYCTHGDSFETIRASDPGASCEIGLNYLRLERVGTVL